MLCKRLRRLPNAHGHLLHGPGSRMACESVRFGEAAALLWEGLEPTSSHTVPPSPTGPGAHGSPSCHDESLRGRQADWKGL